TYHLGGIVTHYGGNCAIYRALNAPKETMMKTPKAVPTATTIDFDDDQRRLLSRFEPRRRGHLANLFLSPVRQVISSVEQVVDSVRAELQQAIARNRRYRNFSTVQRKQEYLTLLESHPEEAIDFALWAVWYENLSDEERTARKAEQGKLYRRQWMDTQPATDKQVSYLRHLGWTGEVKSKLHASELIERIR
ncbi:MAG: hypothetical protein O7E52_23950, partial [Candidatus Poribacteria bacterium]|nr:hypothetical protein [Candidatus Poribacteria bacterium]